ncbi:hypothetical protein [Pseudomonas syringae group genomosp. 3]|uniref:hypothetical protein n=1 Tax=Pseudomonas syringae group genomosp. 3 TaxID=251701 RepID=UPI0016054890|nr:hypothetical protein [Pseudomonas syringae group genomosp. 3]
MLEVFYPDQALYIAAGSAHSAISSTAQFLRRKAPRLSLSALKRVKKAPKTGVCPRLERPAKSAERTPQNGAFYQAAITFNAIC